MLKIKNIIVNNGIKEYNFDQIHSDKSIYDLTKSIIILSGIESLTDRVNSENGLVYINSDFDFSKGNMTLKNVSTELLDEWNQKRP